MNIKNYHDSIRCLNINNDLRINYFASDFSPTQKFQKNEVYVFISQRFEL
jgi:hypothetical protein